NRPRQRRRLARSADAHDQRVRRALRHGGGRFPHPGAVGARLAARQSGSVDSCVRIAAIRIRGRQLDLAVAEPAAVSEPATQDDLRRSNHRTDPRLAAANPFAVERGYRGFVARGTQLLVPGGWRLAVAEKRSRGGGGSWLTTAGGGSHSWQQRSSFS